MKLVILTGLSGSGKTAALNALEDMGYFTMDNIPCKMATSFMGNIESQFKDMKIEKVGLGIDMRSIARIEEFLTFLQKIEEMEMDYTLIFLEASNEVILNRYNLTRRKHPIEAVTLLESIELEREIMSEIKEQASIVIDSSHLKAKELSEKITRVAHLDTDKEINIHLQSFGFKYGIPIDIDLLFDVRILPNPYYIEELKEKTGYDEGVANYVMSFEISAEFYKKLYDMILFLLPHYIEDGKKHFSIGIGCSGGKHRSVTFVNKLKKDLEKLSEVKV
ncbi:MAG: RNase adapter RapZ, partial [Cetobacterium sp.]